MTRCCSDLSPSKYSQTSFIWTSLIQMIRNPNTFSWERNFLMLFVLLNPDVLFPIPDRPDSSNVVNDVFTPSHMSIYTVKLGGTQNGTNPTYDCYISELHVYAVIGIKHLVIHLFGTKSTFPMVGSKLKTPLYSGCASID